MAFNHLTSWHRHDRNAAFLKVVVIFSLALISPGPDFAIVSSVALARGRADGIKCAAGIAAGICFYMLICLTGMSALLTQSLWLAIALKACGGLYLCYLGFMMLRSHPQMETTALPDVPRKSAFRVGLITNLTNVKAIAFFASIFALALTHQIGIGAKLLIGIWVPLETFLWFAFVAFWLSKDAIRSRYRRFQGAIDKGIGGILTLLGAKLFFTAAKEGLNG